MAYNETATVFSPAALSADRVSRNRGTFVLGTPTGDSLFRAIASRVGWIASHYMSYVHDNSLWIPSGPIDGTRFSFTAGISSDFTNSRFDSYLLSGDWRRYFRLGRRSTYAVRTLGFYSGGDRPRRINIGGTLGLRGYPQFGHILGSHAFMLNQELRFPVLTHLTLGTPFGDLDSPRYRRDFAD